jgi:transposase
VHCCFEQAGLVFQAGPGHRVKHAAWSGPLTGNFDDHRGELARMLLDQIDALTAQIFRLGNRRREAL